ncbi:hypothetical protein ES707_07582 [subsurface metagenome]
MEPGGAAEGFYRVAYLGLYAFTAMLAIGIPDSQIP